MPIESNLEALRLKIKSFICWIGWHGPRTVTGFNGCSIKAKCNWCDYKGMVDSQGNLF